MLFLSLTVIFLDGKDTVYYACFDMILVSNKDKYLWIYFICCVWILTGIILYKKIKIYIKKYKDMVID